MTDPAIPEQPDAPISAGEALDLIDYAIKVLGEVCSGKQRFVMRVPVDPHDPDIVIGQALRAARQHIYNGLVATYEYAKEEEAGGVMR